MITIQRIEKLSALNELKKEYFSQSTAPLDGMWHFGFVPMAAHFGFYAGKVLIGFCCVNDEGYLLQFLLKPNRFTSAHALFTLLAQQNSSILNEQVGEIKGAFVSTAEPEYLSLCLDNSSSFNVNSLMYQQSSVVKGNTFNMELATEEQLEQFVAFSMANIGAPEEWLKGYYQNLIKRRELFGYWSKGEILAAGECRLFDELQCEFADLGMIVAEAVRGQGIAKQVLKFLRGHASSQNLVAICSTERVNVGAQKAIVGAGFRAVNRIVQFEFNGV